MADLIQKTIRWKDNGQEQTVLFGVGEFNDTMDDQVFFWVQDIEELNSLNEEF